MKIREQISEKFSVTEEGNFVGEVFGTLSAISKFPKVYPESKLFKGARKAVIHPHSTLFYRIESKNKIRLLLFWDNRKKPRKVKS